MPPHSRIDLPPEVLISIQRVLSLHQDDPLDNLGTFEPVETLNVLFPDEVSLSQVSAVQSKIREDTALLEAEIASLSEQLAQEKHAERVQLIQEMIADLLAQVTRIREKATESEAVVKNITKEIQSLDFAKSNIMQSMTVLKRYQMLTNALVQLDESMQHKKYSDIGSTLSAIKELSSFFKDFRSIDQIADAWRRIQYKQGTIRAMLEEEYDKFLIQDPGKPIKFSTVAEVCAAAEVLGVDVKSHFIDKYCSTELREYRRIFRATDEAGQLDNISRRFAWFKRILKLYDDEHSRAFPPSWNVGQHLCAKFLDITRDDLAGVLEKSAKILTVTLLLSSLKQTQEFEAYVAQKYNEPLSKILSETSSQTLSYRPATKAFEPHMNVYIEAQDKALSDLLAPHRSGKSRSSLEGSVTSSETPPTVLPSSTELFLFYAQNLEQCSVLTTGRPLFEMASLYKKWLQVYAEDVLLASMKKPEKERKSLEGKLDQHEVVNGCLLVNTADYCQTTALELEEKIRAKIDDEFKEQLTFQNERDFFVGVISSGILFILRQLELACDPSFASMQKMSFGSVENVTAVSPYVTTLTSAIESTGNIVREGIVPKKYLRNYFDKGASLVLTRFCNGLVRSRPLKEAGAEQLLLDLQALKACLLKITGDSFSEAAQSTYVKGVTKTTTQLETLLKVVNAPDDPSAGFINNYMVLIGDMSYQNFQKILDLKGTPRAEHNSLMDLFLTMTSTHPELENTSFLSNLDMEPNAAQLTAPVSGKPSLPGLFVTGSVGGDGLSPSLFGGFSPPALSRSSTPGSTKAEEGAVKKTAFGDLRRLVTFGRRDSLLGATQ